MHALDYLVYGYLQMAQDVEAKKVVDEARAIMADLAARKLRLRPSHRALRHGRDRGALGDGARPVARRRRAIEPRPNRFAHTESMIYFARAIGAARTGNAGRARIDVDQLAALRDALQQAKNTYWAEQVEIQRRAAAAWVARAEGKNDEALRLMRSAAELEESTEKHNITPGPIATARELLRRPADGSRPAGAGRARIRGVAQARPRALQGASRGRARRRAGG